MDNSLLEFSDSLPPLTEQKPTDVYEVSGSDGSGNRTSNSETREEMQASFAGSSAASTMVDSKIAAEAAVTNARLEDKANKIHEPLFSTLEDLAIGDVPGEIIFDTSAAPAAPAGAGSVELDDGSRFDITAGGDLRYTKADTTVIAIYIGGAWQTAQINTGAAAVTAVTDVDGGAWKYGAWQSGETILDLEDVFSHENTTREELDNLVEAVNMLDDEAVKKDSFTTGRVMTNIDVEQQNPDKAAIRVLRDDVDGGGGDEYTRDILGAVAPSIAPNPVYRGSYADLPAIEAAWPTAPEGSIADDQAAGVEARYASGVWVDTTNPINTTPHVITTPGTAGLMTALDKQTAESAKSLLTGATGNIQGQLDAIVALGQFYKGFDTYADLMADTGSPTLNDYADISEDENYAGKATRYKWMGTVWLFDRILPNETRNFETNPIQTSELDDEAVTTAKIADGAVTEAKLGDGAVSSGKLEDGAVTAGKIAGSAVGTAKLANRAVTTAKLNDSAVTEAKLASEAVSENKLKDKAATNAKLADMPANTIKGTGVAGSPKDLTADEVAEMVGLEKDGDGTRALLDNGTYGAAGKVNAVDSIEPDPAITDPDNPKFRNVITKMMGTQAEYNAWRASADYNPNVDFTITDVPDTFPPGFSDAPMDGKQYVRKNTNWAEIEGLLKLISDSTQGIFSDIALKTYDDGGITKGFRLMGTAPDGTEHTVIKLGQYGPVHQINLGSKTIHLNLKNIGPVGSDNHITCDTNDADGNPVKLSLAWLTDVVSQCAATLASAKGYTDDEIQNHTADALILQDPCKESELPPEPSGGFPTSHNGYFYQITDFDVSHPGEGKKGSAVWYDSLDDYYPAIDTYHSPDEDTITQNGNGEFKVKDQAFTITEALTKAAGGVAMGFKAFWQWTLNSINALISFATRADGFATSAQGTKADNAVPLASPFSAPVNSKSSIIIEPAFSQTYNQGMRINRSPQVWSGIALGGKKGTTQGMDPAGYDATNPTPSRNGDGNDSGNATWWIASDVSGDLELTQVAGKNTGLTLTRDGDILFKGTSLFKPAAIIQSGPVTAPDGIFTGELNAGVLRSSGAKNLTLTVKDGIAYLNGWCAVDPAYTGGQVNACGIYISDLYLPLSANKNYIMLNPGLDKPAAVSPVQAATAYLVGSAVRTGAMKPMIFRTSAFTAGTYGECFFNESWPID